MVGGRRKLRQCRWGQFSTTQLEYPGGVTLFKADLVADTSAKHDRYASVATFSNADCAQDEGLFFDPLLPRCRHCKSHAVTLRHLKKHEMHCPSNPNKYRKESKEPMATYMTVAA